MLVQIYEIQDPREAEKCIELCVNHIGSVLLSKETWRDPLLREVFLSTEGTESRNSMIPLFNQLDILYKAIDYYQPYIIHFCETLTDKMGRSIPLEPIIHMQIEIKEMFPDIKVMRSIPIPPKGRIPQFPALEIARTLEPVSDFFLTDTWLGEEPVEGYIGITGKTVDWEMARSLVNQSNIPVILAGGLSPENVYDALMKTLPAGADSCTHTNMRDKNNHPIRFKKDFDKVKQFVSEVRRAEKGVGLNQARG